MGSLPGLINAVLNLEPFMFSLSVYVANVGRYNPNNSVYITKINKKKTNKMCENVIIIS